jgi:serine/threonine protein kinase
MWMELPPTYNVMSGLKIDIAQVPAKKTVSNKDTSFIDLPVMVMERMEGDLKSWIGNDNFGNTDRLFALAQAFNGLLYLYSNDIEGHGDLKPENFLYANLGKNFSLEKDSWLSNHPWIVKIADLGWADAWVDYGYTTKAFRQYLAPERIKREEKNGVFIPEASDTFAMGVIASELLQGKHPAKNFKKCIKSEGNWIRWAKNHDPDLSNIKSDRLRSLVFDCLHPDYQQRPTTNKCFEEICCELREEHDLDVEPTLKLWRRNIANEFGVSKSKHAADVAVRTIKLGGEQNRHTRENLEKLIDDIVVSSIETCEDWTSLASSLLYIYESEGDSSAKVQSLQASGTKHLELLFSNFDKSQLDALPLPKAGTRFEKLGDVVKRLAYVANITYENSVRWEVLSDLALAAFAFASASIARINNQDHETIQNYLEEAIQLAPNEATLFYFRAFWGYCGQELNYRRTKNESSFHGLIEDLEHALMLEPTWNEPRKLLEELRDPSKLL